MTVVINNLGRSDIGEVLEFADIDASTPLKFLLSTRHDVSRINGLPMQPERWIITSADLRVKAGNPK